MDSSHYVDSDPCPRAAGAIVCDGEHVALTAAYSASQLILSLFHMVKQVTDELERLLHSLIRGGFAPLPPPKTDWTSPFSRTVSPGNGTGIWNLRVLRLRHTASANRFVFPSPSK